MSTNDIYKAPEAELRVDTSDVEDELFPVSVRKLWIMHMLTFTVYDVYWFYGHWNQMKQKHHLSVWPAVRGVFFILFVYATFKRIQEAAEAKGLSDVPNLKLYAVVWYLLFVGSVGLGMWLGMTNPEFVLNSVWFSPALTLVGNVLTGFLMAPAQHVANRVLGDEAGRKNDRISAANVAWIVVAVVIYGLSWAEPFLR